MTALVIDVHLLDVRWHGTGDWPPSPFRLYQALVAGAYGGRWRSEDDGARLDEAFEWLERLEAPAIVAPVSSRPSAVTYYVPDNDLDAEGNDPRNVGNIRSKKMLRSRLLGDPSLRYIWSVPDGDTTHAEDVVVISERLHLFGRGVDGAFARGAVRSDASLDDLADEIGGHVSLPSASGERRAGEVALPCPDRGSLASLHTRFAANQRRFVSRPAGRGRMEIAFVQPPKARSRMVAFDRPLRAIVFELRSAADDTTFASVRLEDASLIAVGVRNLLAERLAPLDDSEFDVTRMVLGRGITDADRPKRLQIVPLPSIGHRATNAAIRRVVVMLSPDCAAAESDVRWALAGRIIPSLATTDVTTGEVRGPRLVGTDEDDMLVHYGIRRNGSHRWSTVTPIVVPRVVRRGRVTGSERLKTMETSSAAISAALRHAGIEARAVLIQTQVEPFSPRGALASAFAPDRFDRRQLVHATITFDRAIAGPIVLGDGRWLGLGVMRPEREERRPADIDDAVSVAAEEPGVEADESVEE